MCFIVIGDNGDMNVFEGVGILVKSVKYCLNFNVNGMD